MTDLSAAINPIKEALKQGEAREKVLREELDTVKEQNAKARRALAVLDPSVDAQKAKKTRKGRTGFMISTERAQAVLDAIHTLNDLDQPITQPEARLLSGVPQTAVSKAFRYLRSLEIIGRAGIDPATGRERYRVLNDVKELPTQNGDGPKKRYAKRVPATARIEMIRKYLADYGTEGLHVREIDGKTAFTVGALMNALTEAQYEGTKWDRSKGHKYIQPLIEDGTLVDLGEHGDYRYLAIATPVPNWVKEAQKA